MKKLSLLLSLVFIATAGFAQVSIVPKAGVTVSTVAYDDERIDGQKNVIGFTGGLGLNFSLTDDQFLSIQPELLYTQKGFAASKSGAVDYDGTYRLNYLELPVLVKLGFGGDVVRAYVNLGPSVGYLLGGRVKGNWDVADFVGDDINEAIEFTDDANNTDLSQLDARRIEFGANFGGGIGFNLGAANLFLDARYNAGLTDFDRERKSKNQTFYFTTGLKIPLGQ